ncbi:hypothetical protein GCM10010149_88690 [Nonomuraea roseoviolacea subsp. roseoviolacea]|uniref:hypothetical protein n=1 Tax=Nonomuraea roseoviolacea TaxID=103837 RepID=UPI0031E12296
MNDAGATVIGQEKPEPQAPELPPLATAFVVFQDPDGQWGASNDPALLSDAVEISKMTHPDEIFAGCASIQADIIAQKTAGMVQQMMVVAARQAQEQAMNAAILSKAGLK